MSIKKYIDLSEILDIQNYEQSFEKWYKIRQKYIKQVKENKKYLYDKYLIVIKPIIYKFGESNEFLSIIVINKLD